MDISATLVKTIAGTKFEDLPAEAVAATKTIILDTLGAALAGTNAPIAQAIAKHVIDWGGKKETTLIGSGKKVPAPNAALANCVMARCREIDDIYERAPTHSSGVLVPSTLAIAEQKGGVSGKDFITAVTLGIDLGCRLSRASKIRVTERLWDLNSGGGVFGVAVAAAKILGLDENQIVNAMGMAYCQLAASDQGITEGREVMTWTLQHAFAAKAGIVSALMARNGFSVASDPIRRYYHICENDQYDPAVLTNELGKRFEVVDISTKPYPCSRTHHGSIHAVITLVTENNINPADIEEISILVNEMTYKASCTPLEEKQNPPTGFDTQFSLPYSVGNAVVRKRAYLEDYTDEAMKDPLVRQVTKRVRPMLNPEIKGPVGRPACVMEIRTKDGETYSCREEFVFGHPRNPMSAKEHEDKFRHCAARGLKPLAKPDVEKLIELTGKLEDVNDVSDVVRLLVTRSQK